MTATIIGLVLIHGGYIATIIGILKNRSLEEQFWAAIQYGTSNPGNIWMIAGIAAIVLGTITLIIAAVRMEKKSKKKSYY